LPLLDAGSGEGFEHFMVGEGHGGNSSTLELEKINDGHQGIEKSLKVLSDGLVEQIGLTGSD
jgi:hypothetical protein